MSETRRNSLLAKRARAAMSRTVYVNALRVALSVGVLLNLVNHSDAIFGNATLPWGGVLVNFIIPFLVSAYSSACACVSE